MKTKSEKLKAAKLNFSFSNKLLAFHYKLLTQKNEHHRNINQTPIADYRAFQRICPIGNYWLQKFEL